MVTGNSCVLRAYVTHNGDRKCDGGPSGSCIIDLERKEARDGLPEKGNQGPGFEVRPMSTSSRKGRCLLSGGCGPRTWTHAEHPQESHQGDGPSTLPMRLTGSERSSCKSVLLKSASWEFNPVLSELLPTYGPLG